MGKGHYFTLYDDGIDDASQLSTDLHEIVKDTDIETLLESEPCCSITVIADAGGMTTTLIFDQNYELTSIETRPSE